MHAGKKKIKNAATATNSQVCELGLNASAQTPKCIQNLKQKNKDLFLCYVVFDVFPKELYNFMIPHFPPYFLHLLFSFLLFFSRCHHIQSCGVLVFFLMLFIFCCYFENKELGL